MKTLRQILAALAGNPAEIAKHAPQACRAVVGTLGELRSSGQSLTSTLRNELLAKVAAGEHVELEIDLLAYEQKNGERNRNSVRFRDGAMVSLGRSGKSTPFLRDHNQHDSLSKGGVIVSSATEKRADGDYAIRQTVKLTAPWAVEMALRGLMDRVSIGWRPTGPVLCSACNSPIFARCYHFPGDRLVEKDDEGGGKRKVRAADGPIVVEWVFTEAELVETSVVNIPGVPGAGVDEVRASMLASLSAANPGLRPIPGHEGFDLSQENEMDPELLKLLGLAATASADEVLTAVTNKLNAANADKAALAILQKDLGGFKTELDAMKAEQRKAGEDKFIADALSSGRIAKGDEEQWRALHAVDAKRAVELMGKREVGSATPVGAPRQSGGIDPSAEPAPVPTAPPAPVLLVEGGGVPGYTLYERGSRSKVERKEIAQALALAVQALETHPNPAARWWAQRMGFEGRIAQLPTKLAATAIVNNGDLDAARTAFRAAFMQSLEQAAVSPLEMLYTTVPTNTPLARIHWMGDLPGFEEWIGDRKLSGVEAFKLDLQSKKWANGLRIKNDDVKFDNLGLMPQQIGGLATKARRHRLDRMAGMLIDGFAGGTTSNGLGYDGAFFFADAHRGGNDNKMTVALDAAGLTAGELLLESMTTYDGNDALDIHGTHLIVGPKLRATAEKLLTQDRLANGEDNYHRGKYKLIVDNRLRGTADDYWYLTDLSHEIKPFIFQLVEDITTSAIMGQESNNSMPSFMNDELMFGAQANYNMSYFEFRLIVGSLVA